MNYLLPTLKTLLGYENSVEAYDDRSNHRALWFELIKAINFHDPTTLGRKIFEDKDIYCGIRNITEYGGLRDIDLGVISIWVDASKRHPPEDDKSCTVTSKDMDYILDNNGTLEELKTHISTLMKQIKGDDNGNTTSTRDP